MNSISGIVGSVGSGSSLALAADTATTETSPSQASNGTGSGGSTATGPSETPTQSQAAKSVNQPAELDVSRSTGASLESVVFAQLEILVTPPFDGLPSARALAEATAQKLQFERLIEAIGQRAESQIAAPAAAEQEAVAKVESPSDQIPV